MLGIEHERIAIYRREDDYQETLAGGGAPPKGAGDGAAFRQFNYLPV
jgi:hypothetical protein